VVCALRFFLCTKRAFKEILWGHPSSLVVLHYSRGFVCINGGLSSNASASVGFTAYLCCQGAHPAQHRVVNRMVRVYHGLRRRHTAHFYRKAPRRLRRSTLAPASGIDRTFAAKASTQRNIELCIVWFVHTMVCHSPKILTL